MHTGLVLAGVAGVWGHRTGGQKHAGELQWKVTMSWKTVGFQKGEAERERRYKDGAT